MLDCCIPCGLGDHSVPDGREGLLDQMVHHIGDIPVMRVKGSAVDVCPVDDIRHSDLVQGLLGQQIRQSFVDQFSGADRAAGGDQAQIDNLFARLELAQAQLQNDTYSRMVVYLTLPEEGDETYAFLNEMRAIIGRYYENDYYVVGNSTSCRDLSASFVTDNLMISILSSFFVIVVLLFTFQSAGLPVLLIIVIQGSVWINFSFPKLMDQPLYFLGYLVVQAIQMGANIDYAIVISSHYQELKAHMPHKEAIIHALNAAFPAVFTSGTIMASTGLLQDQTQTARDAVETLLPDTDDPQLPDTDTVLAAQNSLSTAIGAMPGTVRGIASATRTTVNSLTRDLNAVSGQISAMSQTLHNASENLGGSITDVSDMDTPEMLAGKVEACVNYGGVLADLNVGGIAGAVAMENDLDILEDWERNGEESLNFRSELRAVILDCRNDGTVTGTKQNVGGIAGWQSLGLVRNSENTGKIDAADAEYMGGISGLSTGYIRDGYAKCEIRGKSCVGGIAGSGTIATDCISMVQLLGGNEKLGAILGSAEESTVQDGEPPISGNIYPRLIEDAGAIDGISYAGLAEGMALDAFLALENLPELFRSVTVRFAFEDGSEKRIQLRPGSSLAADRIPGIPEKNGFTALWEGLENTDLGSIACDMRFEAAYIPCRTAIQSGQTRDSGLPLVLAEGVFTASAAVSAEASGEVPGLTEKETLLEVWTIHVPDGAEAVRFLLPDGAEDPKLLLRRPDGIWSEAAYARDESYLVVRMTAGDVQLALVQAQTDPPVLLTAGISLAALALLAAALIRRKRSRQRTPPSPRC